MKILFLISALFLALSPLSGLVMQEIDSLDQLAPLFEEADKETLVVFDVDNVLTIPDHPAFQIANWKEHREIVHGHYHSLEVEQQEALMMLMITENRLLLIERAAPEWINRLGARGVPVIALTKAWSGGDFPQQRCAVLRALGIELNGQSSWGERVVFDQFPFYNDAYPLYQGGVLFTNGQAVAKGDLLAAFFKSSGFCPKRICFIDDYRDNLVSVGEVMGQLGIPCDLYWYHGAKHFQTEAIDRVEMASVWNGYVERAKEIAP